MLGQGQQWCLCINDLTGLMKGSFRGKARGANLKSLLITELSSVCLGLDFLNYFLLRPLGDFFPIFFQNEKRGEAVLFSWMCSLSQGSFPRVLGLGKCQVAK